MGLAIGAHIYQELSAASVARRQEYAARLFDDLQTPERFHQASFGYRSLCAYVLHETDVATTPDEGRNQDGVFSAFGSVELLRGEARVRGFLSAIRRAETMSSAVDAGAGSSGLLALSAAVYHGACVTAYELNPKAAGCAGEIARLFGHENVVTVHCDDVLDPSTPLPDVEYAFTETYYKGGFKEKGLQISGRLATVAGNIIPAYIDVLGVTIQKDRDPDEFSAWRPAAEYSLRELSDGSAPPHIVGKFRPNVTGACDVAVRLRYYGPDGQLMLGGVRDDEITAPITIGSIDVSPGHNVTFAYESGSDPQSAHVVSVPRIAA